MLSALLEPFQFSFMVNAMLVAAIVAVPCALLSVWSLATSRALGSIPFTLHGAAALTDSSPDPTQPRYTVNIEGVNAWLTAICSGGHPSCGQHVDTSRLIPPTWLTTT